MKTTRGGGSAVTVAVLLAAAVPAGAAASGASAAPAAPAAAQDAAADLKRGERLFLQCRACHALGTEQEGKIGPALGGFVGRRAAAVPGFGYSKALAASGLAWDEATLDLWLARPAALVPGTTMVYAGLASPEDRRRLVAYLVRATAPPASTTAPAAATTAPR